MALARVVIVDDEPSLIKFVSANLRASGYDVLDATNGLDGIERVKEWGPDLVLLDVNMPGMDGFEACIHIRQISDAAIIMLTASCATGNKSRALELGADDYVTKPFGIRELMACMQAVMGRASQPEPRCRRQDVIETAELTVDFDQRRVTFKGELVKLTPTEFRLLEELATHSDRVLSERELLSSIWGGEHRGEIEYVRAYVGRLRRKLEEDPANPAHFVTEPGAGYRFRAD